MQSHKHVSISSGRHRYSEQDDYFNDFITIDITGDKYQYEIRSDDIWYEQVPYMPNHGMGFYTEAKRLASEIQNKISEARTLSERDNLIYNQMIQVASANRICLVTKKDQALRLSDNDEKADEQYKKNIVSIPLKDMNFNSKWIAGKSVKDNVINLFQEYIPSFFLFGLFKHKENILKAKKIIHHLANNNLSDEETLVYLQNEVKNFSPANTSGEFNRKLHYIIRKLQNSDLQPLQLAEQEREMRNIRVV